MASILIVLAFIIQRKWSFTWLDPPRFQSDCQVFIVLDALQRFESYRFNLIQVKAYLQTLCCKSQFLDHFFEMCLNFRLCNAKFCDVKFFPNEMYSGWNGCFGKTFSSSFHTLSNLFSHFLIKSLSKNNLPSVHLRFSKS